MIDLNALNEFKPDIEESAKRWDAFWQGEIIDRPVMMSSCNKLGFVPNPSPSYKLRAFGDIDAIIGETLANASGTYFGGDSIPTFWPSSGADEIAAFCGAKLEWNEANTQDTNWSVPFVENWEDVLPVKIDENNYYWKRMIEFYTKCAEAFRGRILPRSLDFHTNMDLLSAMRGPENLCFDLFDCPELIDAAMENARDVFRKCWETCTKAGEMDKYGYYFEGFSTQGSTAVLACDFICMIGTEMFRRWALPTLEYEAGFVDNVVLHWDGPGALKHYDDIMGIKKIHLISYVPNPTESHLDYIDLYKKIQKNGKAVTIWGETDLIKAAHKELDPQKTVYLHFPRNIDDIMELTVWLTKNT